MKESKVRLEIVNCYPFLEDLFALRQADFTACKDDLSPAPSVVKWKAVIEQMKREGAPFTVKELKVNGNDLLSIGLAPERVGTVLHELLLYCALDGSRNEREGLLKRVQKMS